MSPVTLDLLPYARALRTRTASGQQQLWCAVRRRWLVEQPEELVRQALIALLVEGGLPLALMQVERKVGNSADRLDLLVYDRAGAPLVLAEAKAPGYPLQPAMHQLAHYNRALRAPYALAVNGERAICCRLDYATEELEALAVLPDFTVDK